MGADTWADVCTDPRHHLYTHFLFVSFVVFQAAAGQGRPSCAAEAREDHHFLQPSAVRPSQPQPNTDATQTHTLGPGALVALLLASSQSRRCSARPLGRDLGSWASFLLGSILSATPPTTTTTILPPPPPPPPPLVSAASAPRIPRGRKNLSPRRVHGRPQRIRNSNLV